MPIGLNNFKETADKNEKEISEMIKYNNNPFTPKGRMSRKIYFFYTIILNIIYKLSEIPLEKESPLLISLLLIIALIIFGIIQVFCVKKRFYDISLNNKKSWILSIILLLMTFFIAVYPVIIYAITIPIAIYLLVAPSKKSNQTMKNIGFKGEIMFQKIKEVMQTTCIALCYIAFLGVWLVNIVVLTHAFGIAFKLNLLFALILSFIVGPIPVIGSALAVWGGCVWLNMSLITSILVFFVLPYVVIFIAGACMGAFDKNNKEN